MQVAPSASTYAPAPGDLVSQPPAGSAHLFTDPYQDPTGAFADSSPGGFGDTGSQAQPDPYADTALASTSLFAPTDHTPSTTLALMVQAQTKPLLVTPENAAGLGIDLVQTKPLLVTPENAAGLNLPPQTGSAAPASAITPNASPTEIAALELLLAEPANQEIIAQYGPPLRPLNTDTNVGQGILARFGPDLGARLTQLQEAQDGVRNEYLHALDQATQSPGPDTPGSQWVPGTGQGETAEPGHWTLDPTAFSRHYAQGDSLAQRVFADLHGQDPLVFHEGREGDAHSEPSYHTLGPFRLAQGQPYGSDPNLPEACLLRDYTQLTPQHSADLINKEYLWFDPVNGWSTSADNIQAPTGFLDKALPVAFSALMCMVALPPVGNLLSQAGAGTFVQGAAMGAMGSAITQTVMTGGIDFGNLLRSALTGGIAGSVMEISGMGEMLKSADLAESSLAHLGKAGLTGLLQEATGGKFKDGFMNSALASIAQGVGDHLNQQIGELKDISPEQASVLKLLSKAASSALKIAGTNDPAAGFAGEFLSGVLGDGLQGAQGKAQGQQQGQVGNEGPPGDRPSSDWVKNLGASEVDAQGLGLRPGPGGQGLQISGEALSNWSDEIDGGIALNGSMAPETQAITEAVVGKGQGPLAALEAAGLDKQQQIAAYGQLLASGQIQLNAQGVPIVQPGQVLQFDLSDAGAAQLGGRAIAQESAGRAQREQQAAETYAGGAGGGRGFVNPALASEHGRYPFAGRSTITDPNAYIDPRQRTMALADMSNMPAEKYSAEEWRAAALEYKQIQGKDFSRDTIYNGLWTKAAQLDAEAGKGFSRDVINDITGFATSEGLLAQAGVAIGGALGRGIGNRLGGSVDNVLGVVSKKPDGAVPAAGSGVGGVSTNGANTGLTLGDGIVASRVNVRIGDANEKGSGLEYAWKKHGGAWTDNKSAFTISKEELKVVLQAPLVVNTPAYQSATSGNYIRTVDMGRTIGIDAKTGGQPTNFMTVITDSKGNLVNTFPGKTF